jgi:hypothetical protein
MSTDGLLEPRGLAFELVACLVAACVALVVLAGCVQIQNLLAPRAPPPSQQQQQQPQQGGSLSVRPVYDMVPGNSIGRAAAAAEPPGHYSVSDRMLVGVERAVDEQYGQLTKLPAQEPQEAYGQLQKIQPAKLPGGERQLPPLAVAPSERQLPPLHTSHRELPRNPYDVVPQTVQVSARPDDDVVLRLRSKLSNVNAELHVDDAAVDLYNNFPKPPKRDEAVGEYKLSRVPVAREEPLAEYGLKRQLSPREISPRQVSPRQVSPRQVSPRQPQTPPDSDDEKPAAAAAPVYTHVRSVPRNAEHVSKTAGKAARQIAASSKQAF